MRRAALFALALVGCLHPSKVTRVYEGGRIVEGGFLAPEAYEGYLKGVIAEEAGDLRTAEAAYADAIDEDGDDPEPFVRRGSVRCRLGVQSALQDLDRALKIDPTYAPALAARAGCLGDRGKAREGVQVVETVAPGDRGATSLEVLFIRLAAVADVNARSRAIALTGARADSPAAWDALVEWGRAKGDPELVATGLEGLVRAAPSRVGDVEVAALGLAGDGHVALARRVAATVGDLPDALGIRGPHDPVVARLALDEAILREDVAAIERRAVRFHVDLGEAAARALLQEHPALARRLGDGVLGADPSAACATMAAVAAGQKLRVRSSAGAADACVLAVASRLAATGNVAAATSWTRQLGVVVAPRDPVTGPVAVDLAARGVLAAGTLPTALRIELAARRREAPPALDGDVDRKHELLFHALHDPAGAEARGLVAKLRGGANDPVVGFALARIALSGLAPGATDAWAAVRAAIAAFPADPLVLAVAVEVAKHDGASPAALRARLLAFARTPAERTLATE